MNKRWLIALCFTVLLAVAVPLFAFAEAEEEQQGQAVLLQEGEYDITPKAQVSRANASLLGNTVEDKIYQSLVNQSTSFNLTLYRIKIDDFSAIYSDVINDHPELFYVSSTFFYYPDDLTQTLITTVEPQYVMTGEEINEAKAIFDKGAAEALAQVDDSMSDLQKALTLHDYICGSAIYPKELAGNVTSEIIEKYDKAIYHSAYGFFYDRLTVCAGFTLTYSYLMNELGIPCEYVSSDSMGHAWNKVQLDGNWYNIDLTFDNTDNIAGTNSLDAMMHNCFLKSDSYFESESGYNHYGGDTYDTCAASSTIYDDAFWDDVTARIHVINSDYYYIKPGRFSCTLIKRTSNGSETTLATKSCASLTNGAALARLAYLDGRLYLAYSTNICSLSLDGREEHAIAELSYYPFGLGVIDGNLVYNLFNDTTEYTLDKKTYFQNYLTARRGGSYHNYPDVNNDGYINARDWIAMKTP